jgi:hypothetical protein
MIITIKNISDNYTYGYSDQSWGLYCEKKVDGDWVFYPDMFNWSLPAGGAISPGKSVRVRNYCAPRVPGDYRIAVDRFSVKSNHVEIEVREPTNWPLIAGVVSAVVVIGALVAVYFRGRF